MLTKHSRTGVMTVLVVAMSVSWAVEKQSSPPAPRDTPKGEKHHAMARVIQDYKNPYSFAQLEPAPFTIPKGYVATTLIYRWEDSKTGLKNDKLTGTTIYSVTEKRYLKEAKNDPNFVLKAGEYKVVCGGMAGAMGVLGYTLIREDLVKMTDDGVVATPKDRATNRDSAVVKVNPPTIDPPFESTVGKELPRDFDIVYAEGHFKEHPLIFRFRGDKFTAQSQFEHSYPIKEGGKSVYTYQTEIVGTLRQGKAEGTYTYYATGGHFGTGPTDSVGLYYKAWGWGPVTGQADGGTLDLTINMNHHKHIDRIIPGSKPGWGPWKDNTAMMEDAKQVASPWRASTLKISLKLPVGQSKSSQVLVSQEPFPTLPSPE